MTGFDLWLILVGALVALIVQYLIITYAVENGIRRSRTERKPAAWADKPAQKESA